jgi:hypothetical protein
MSGIETIGALAIMYYVWGILKFLYWVAKSLVLLLILSLIGVIAWVGTVGITLPPG